MGGGGGDGGIPRHSRRWNGILVFKHIAVVSWIRPMPSMIQGGFAVFDLDKKQKIFSASPGYVESFSVSDDSDLVSVGYLNGTSTLHVLLIRGMLIQSVLKYPNFLHYTMDTNGEKLYLFGVTTTRAVELKTKQSMETESDFRAFDIYSWAQCPTTYW